MTGSQPEGPKRGYGNIYTPNAGSMIIHVQRESGLANRTIILTMRQVRLLKIGLYTAGIVIAIGAVSWFFLASQAARVPVLTKRVTHLQTEVQRLDTLQAALDELDGRFHQVQRMLGVPVREDDLGSPDGANLSWPLPGIVSLLPDSLHDATPHQGLDIATPRGTPVRAAGAGVVVDIHSDPRYGTIVRIAHHDGYETTYGHVDSTRVSERDTVQRGTVIGLSGGPTRTLPAYLHFAVTHDGANVDPSPLMKKGSRHGDVH